MGTQSMACDWACPALVFHSLLRKLPQAGLGCAAHTWPQAQLRAQTISGGNAQKTGRIGQLQKEARQVTLSTWAPITEHHRLCGLNNSIYFSQFRRLESSRSRCLIRAFHLVFRWLSSPCILTWQGHTTISP